MLTRLIALLGVLAVTAPVAAKRPPTPSQPEPAAAVEMTPLSAAQQALFDGTPADPAPPILDGPKGIENTHYVAGNEWNLHLLRKAVKGRGGAYVGVGTDQAYLFIGWQRPELAWLTDYDEVVVDIHALYRAFLLEAASPAAFVALWTQPEAARARAVIAARLADLGPERVKLLQGRYDKYRGRIRQRLFKLRGVLRDEKVGAFINRQGDYDYVRSLVASGRVRALRVNLLLDGGLAAIGAAAKQLAVPIRVLYLSNAEQYWPYNDAFRRNINALHSDERSWVVHTYSTWKLNQDYRYFVQSLDLFRGWLSRPWVTSVKVMLPPRKDEGLEPDYAVLKRSVEQAEKRRAAKR